MSQYARGRSTFQLLSTAALKATVALLTRDDPLQITSHCRRILDMVTTDAYIVTLISRTAIKIPTFSEEVCVRVHTHTHTHTQHTQCIHLVATHVTYIHKHITST